MAIDAASFYVPVAEQPYPVPENWRWVRLSRAVHTTGERRDDFSDSTILYVGLEHMKKNSGITGNGTVDGVKSLKNVFHKGQILYGKLRPYLNKHDIATFDGLCSTDILVFETYEPALTQYVNFYLDDCDFLEYVVSHSKGIHLPRVSEGTVLNKPIPLPPLPEQRRIVERIESLSAKLDAARDKAQAVVDGYERRRAAILRRAFTGELTAKWREEHGISFSTWEKKHLDETTIKIIDGDRGNHYPKKKKGELTPCGYCVFLNTGNVTKSGFNFNNTEFITKEKDELLHSGRLERGDMIMTTRGTIGNVALYDDSIPYEHLRINSGMVIYRGGREFVKEYLIWLYHSDLIKNQIKALQTGSAQPQLPIKVMNAIILPVPCIEEQREIVRILDRVITIEKQVKESAETVLSTIDLMKKAILGRAFRGQLGTNNPEEESAARLIEQIPKK